MHSTISANHKRKQTHTHAFRMCFVCTTIIHFLGRDAKVKKKSPSEYRPLFSTPYTVKGN